MQTFEQAQGNLGQALGHLVVSVEAYPDLRSSDQIIVLLAQLEGTENRINVARISFNMKVQEYNLSIREFPGRFLASMCSFQRKAYFHSNNEAQGAVQVHFK
ncbi:LemA family protein [Desulfosediminicola sp.]|uniref:LemA family protein n=1 Tax=Desulfosediminicola sp. TaxID=2886825 RepID=UPI003AF2EFDE